jgi:hypothetical protein
MDKGITRTPRQHDEIMEEIVEQQRLEILQQVRERQETIDAATRPTSDML